MTKIHMNSLKKNEDALAKMDELMSAGLVKKGDTLYITINPNKSKAILIDSKYVNFNGQKMTLNDWGCKVTGWKSIRIYAYAAIDGEIETTLQQISTKSSSMSIHSSGTNYRETNLTTPPSFPLKFQTGWKMQS